MDSKGIVAEEPGVWWWGRTKVTKRSMPPYRQVPKERHKSSIGSASIRLFKSICFWALCWIL